MSRLFASGSPRRDGGAIIQDNWSVKVAELMRTEPVTVGPDACVAQIAEVLITHNLGVVPVLAPNGALLGVVRDTNLLTRPRATRTSRLLGPIRRAVRKRQVPIRRARWASAALCAKDLMTRPVDTAHPREDAAVVLRRMLANGREHLPVVREGKLVGMLNRVDLIKAFNRPDEAIAGEVRAILANPLRVPAEHRVEFTVSDGVVRLRGTTRHPSDIAVLRSVLSRVRGVIDVKCTVRPRHPEPRSNRRPPHRERSWV